MRLVSDHTFDAWVSKQEHVILYLVVKRLFINVVFAVLGITGLLKREPLHAHSSSVDDYAFVERLRRNNVFHSADELELIFVKLLDVADRGGAKGRLLVIFLEKGTDYFWKFAVLVNVLQVHGRLFLEWDGRLTKH